MNKHVFSLLALLLTLLFVSCSGGTPPPIQRDYADAVTNINQVDPYYRQFFRSQNASNYSLSDQRHAYLAAMQTARTPVRAMKYKPSPSRTRLATRGKGYKKRGKGISSKRGVAKRKGSTKARRQATASRRSPARRGSRRRG